MINDYCFPLFGYQKVMHAYQSSSNFYEIHSLPKTKLTPLNTLCAGLTKLITRTATRGTCCGGCGRRPSCCRWIIYSRCAARPLTGIYNIYTISIQYLRILEHQSSEIKIARNNICCDASTMCDETVYWDLNYSLQVTLYTWEQWGK